MPEKRLKTAQLNLKIAPALKDAAEKAAKADNRTLTALIEKLLHDHLSRRIEGKRGGGRGREFA
jgi:hypothetical protein